MVTLPSPSTKLKQHLDDYLFAPGNAANLGFLRCLFFGYVFLQYANYHSWPWADVSPLFWSNWSQVDMLGFPPLPGSVLMVLDLIWKAALVCSCVGLLTRWSTKVSFVLGLYLLGLPQNYSKISHLVGLLVLTMLVLACSRCGQALSVDAWLRRKRGLQNKVPAGEFTWPIRLVWLLHSVAFFAAGWAKLVGDGWIMSDNLRYQFILHHYLDDRNLSSIGLYIAQSSLLCATLALITVAIELAAPMAMFNRWARRIVIPSLLLLQLGNAYILGVHATLPWACIYAFWVPWDRIGKSLWQMWKREQAPGFEPEAG